MMTTADPIETAPPTTPRPPRGRGQTRGLTEADAIDIWIARWLRVPPKELRARYACDQRRLYDVWWGHKHPASRAKAETLFLERYPAIADRTVFGYRRIPRARDADPRQITLFD